jgi:cytochrome c
MIATRGIILAVSVVGLLASACAKREVSYRSDVQPILQGNCGTCHNSNGIGYAQSGFSVQTYAALMKGTRHGPVVIPGQSSQSNLVWLLKHGAHPQINMPKLCEQMGQEVGKCAAAATYARQLPEGKVKLIARWVDQGARDN